MQRDKTGGRARGRRITGRPRAKKPKSVLGRRILEIYDRMVESGRKVCLNRIARMTECSAGNVRSTINRWRVSQSRKIPRSPTHKEAADQAYEWLMEHAYSAEWLANHIGVSTTHINDWLSTRSTMSIDCVSAVLDLMGMELRVCKKRHERLGELVLDRPEPKKGQEREDYEWLRPG